MEFNAMVFESGHIIVARQMLEELDDEEMAFVLAHELSHLKARHMSERYAYLDTNEFCIYLFIYLFIHYLFNLLPDVSLLHSDLLEYPCSAFLLF
jgi:Zn-dependent protease with chaperone function